MKGFIDLIYNYFKRMRVFIVMANIQSAKKRIRQSATRTKINSSRRSRIRTFLRHVENAISSGNQINAQEALKSAQPELMRGVVKGVLSKRSVSRKISRFNARVKALSIKI